MPVGSPLAQVEEVGNRLKKAGTLRDFFDAFSSAGILPEIT